MMLIYAVMYYILQLLLSGTQIGIPPNLIILLYVSIQQ